MIAWRESIRAVKKAETFLQTGRHWEAGRGLGIRILGPALLSSLYSVTFECRRFPSEYPQREGERRSTAAGCHSAELALSDQSLFCLSCSP